MYTHFVMPFLLFQLSHLAFPFRSSMPGRAVLQSPSDAWVLIMTIMMAMVVKLMVTKMMGSKKMVVQTNVVNQWFQAWW